MVNRVWLVLVLCLIFDVLKAKTSKTKRTGFMEGIDEIIDMFAAFSRDKENNEDSMFYKDQPSIVDEAASDIFAAFHGKKKNNKPNRENFMFYEDQPPIIDEVSDIFAASYGNKKYNNPNKEDLMFYEDQPPIEDASDIFAAFHGNTKNYKPNDKNSLFFEDQPPIDDEELNNEHKTLTDSEISAVLYGDQENIKLDNEDSKFYEELQPPVVVEGCGLSDIRIVGGYFSAFGSNPWQAALMSKSSIKHVYCGGSLLNERWVITAAHCLYKKSTNDFLVRLGDLDLRDENEELSYEEYSMEKIKLYPDYSPTFIKNDIALVKLDRRVYFRKNISPICLPSPTLNLDGKIATVSGWGVTSEAQNSATMDLQEVQVEIITNDECQKWFHKAGRLETISEVSLCAGYKEGGHDSCQGDSGGPLTLTVEGRRTLIGIVSWGIGCGRKNLPGVYTRVQKFIPWINNVLA